MYRDRKTDPAEKSILYSCCFAFIRNLITENNLRRKGAGGSPNGFRLRQTTKDICAGAQLECTFFTIPAAQLIAFIQQDSSSGYSSFSEGNQPAQIPQNGGFFRWLAAQLKLTLVNTAK